MPYGLTLTSAPATEPMTAAETKVYRRVDTDDTTQDDVITSLIMAARAYVETYTGRQLVTATWTMTLDCFPAEIKVPRPPLQSVTSINYVATDGTSTLLAASDYQVSATVEPGRIVPAYGVSWPDTRAQLAAVTIVFVCGYGAAAAVPALIKAAMGLLIGCWYEKREPTAIEWDAVHRLLDMYWEGVYR